MFIKKSQRYLSPPVVISGPGCLEDAAFQMAKLGKKALVVTDATMRQVGLVERLEHLLQQAGVAAAVFDRVNEEPTTRHVEEGVACLEGKRLPVPGRAGWGKSH
jgi:alcohol dehydrogenase class IV